MGLLTKLLRADTAFSIKEINLEYLAPFKGGIAKEDLKIIDNACGFINATINDYEKRFKSLGSILYRQRMDSRFLAKSEFELSVFVLNAFMTEMKSKNTPVTIRAGIRYRIGVNGISMFSPEIVEGPYGTINKPLSSFDNFTKERQELFLAATADQDLDIVISNLSEYYSPLLIDIPFARINADNTIRELSLLGVSIENLRDRDLITEYLSEILNRHCEIFRGIVP